MFVFEFIYFIEFVMKNNKKEEFSKKKNKSRKRMIFVEKTKPNIESGLYSAIQLITLVYPFPGLLRELVSCVLLLLCLPCDSPFHYKYESKSAASTSVIFLLCFVSAFCRFFLLRIYLSQRALELCLRNSVLVSEF